MLRTIRNSCQTSVAMTYAVSEQKAKVCFLDNMMAWSEATELKSKFRQMHKRLKVVIQKMLDISKSSAHKKDEVFQMILSH